MQVQIWCSNKQEEHRFCEHDDSDDKAKKLGGRIPIVTARRSGVVDLVCALSAPLVIHDSGRESPRTFVYWSMYSMYVGRNS